MLCRRFKRCKVLVVSSHCTRARVTLALKAGSLGVLGKTQQLTELVVAIRTVAQGRIYLQRGMLSVLQEGESALRQMTIASKLETAMPLRLSGSLTPKEQEVLRCFLDGMSVNSIAAKFSRSASTISTQKQSAYRKLGIRTDSELFMFTKQFGRPD